MSLRAYEPKMGGPGFAAAARAWPICSFDASESALEPESSGFRAGCQLGKSQGQLTGNMVREVPGPGPCGMGSITRSIVNRIAAPGLVPDPGDPRIRQGIDIVGGDTG